MRLARPRSLGDATENSAEKENDLDEANDAGGEVAAAVAAAAAAVV